MASMIDLVDEFYEAAGINHPKETHLKLIAEELKEFHEAWQNLLKEFSDLNYVIIGGHNQGMTDDEIDEALGEYKDLVGWVLNTLPREIVGEAFSRVHNSNMSKLTNGVAVRDEVTGKILKGSNYKAPDLSDLI